jgi:hypothetical protein
VILRAERPHPGAQLTFTDADGMRITAFITDIGDRVITGQTAGLELRPPSARPRRRPHLSPGVPGPLRDVARTG